jgi:peptide deformylase
MELITNNNKALRRISKSIKKAEVSEVLKDLILTLKENPAGYNIAAPQIGINKRIVFINVVKPLILINPKIVESKYIIPYIENCISFPQRLFETNRYAYIKVEAENFKSELSFGIKEKYIDLLDDVTSYAHPMIHECIAIQQSIDYINGITPLDRQSEKDKGISANTISISKNGKIKKIKVKKLQDFEKMGWTLNSN